MRGMRNEIVRQWRYLNSPPICYLLHYIYFLPLSVLLTTD